MTHSQFIAAAKLCSAGNDVQQKEWRQLVAFLELAIAEIDSLEAQRSDDRAVIAGLRDKIEALNARL